MEDSVKEVELLSEAKAFANSVSQGDIAVKPEVEVAETSSDNEDSGMI